jgi:hypothetical protein
MRGTLDGMLSRRFGHGFRAVPWKQQRLGVAVASPELFRLH